MVHKALEDVVQSVLEQAYSPPLVLQDFYWFDVLMNVDSNEVAPDIGNHDDGKEIGHTRMVMDEAAGQARPLLEKYADCSIKNSPGWLPGESIAESEHKGRSLG